MNYRQERNYYILLQNKEKRCNSLALKTSFITLSYEKKRISPTGVVEVSNNERFLYVEGLISEQIVAINYIRGI